MGCLLCWSWGPLGEPSFPLIPSILCEDWDFLSVQSMCIHNWYKDTLFNYMCLCKLHWHRSPSVVPILVLFWSVEVVAVVLLHLVNFSPPCTDAGLNLQHLLVVFSTCTQGNLYMLSFSHWGHWPIFSVWDSCCSLLFYCHLFEVTV